MSFGDVVALIVVEGLVGLLVLTILWPTKGSAKRLLRRWLVSDPTDAELAEALTYLRRRRLWYPWLLIGLPMVVDYTGLLSENRDDSWSFPAVLLIGGLLAELFAQRRGRRPVRAAIPVRRGLTDIVPGWALILHTVTALGAFVLLGCALAGVGWARHWYPNWSTRLLWIALIAAALVVLVVWAVVGLALRRPAIAELRIDPVLRTRSARVPVGLGIATLCALIGGGQSDFRGGIIIVAGLFLWSAIASPVRRRRARPALA
ncbi:MAG TPA: hypothetical protein VJ914_33535 [Pseudonocardiaceae bacterium]|nr:hypothetical protein [Pseudonocardiaceae bacterium]